MSQITSSSFASALRRGQVAWRAARSAGFVACLTLALVLVPAALASMLTNNGASPVVPHDLIAHTGGVIKVMRVVGGHLWMGFGPRLVAVDTANPAAPRIVGRSPLLGGSVQDLATGSAYPNAIGARPDVAWALLAGNSLVGLDITDPAHPAPLGSVEVLTTCVGVAAVGDHVWLATQEGDLVGYDVGDPLAPTPAGRLDDIAGRMDVHRVGAVAGHVVLATSGYGSPQTPILHVIDVRDPLHPQEVAALANPGPKDWLLRDMYIDDRIAWIVGGHPETLVGVDLTVPSAPDVLGRLESDEFYIADRITVAEGHAYLTGGDGGHNYFETSVVDVRDRTAPRLLASHALSRTSDPTTGMAGTGGHLWYGTYDGHLFVLDARNGSSGLPTVANVQTIGSAGQMSVAGDLGLLSMGEALLTLDLQRPDVPRPLTTTLVHYYPNAMAITGNAALVVTQGNMDVLGGELHVLRVSEPAAPKVVASLYRAHDPQQIAITGSLAAMLATSREHDYGNHEVWLLQTFGPSTPTRIATMPISGGVQDVAFGGRLVYALSPDSWTSDPAAVALVIGDVSDPQNPSPMSTLRLTGLIPKRARARVAAEGHVAYVVTWGHDTDYRRVVENAIHVVDASDPRQPVRVAKIPLDAPPAGISAAHGYLFLPGAGGVLVIDVRDPAVPAPMGLLPTGGDAAVDAVVQDGLVYVTAGGGGLYVFSPQLDGWPTAEIPPTPTPTPETPTATASPPRPLPDLAGVAMYDCSSRSVHVTVRNVGSADAGPFEVRSVVGRASWQVPGLAADETLNLNPRRQSGGGDFVLIDADQEVVELDETNNRLEVPFVTCPPHRLFLPVLLDGTAIRAWQALERLQPMDNRADPLAVAHGLSPSSTETAVPFTPTPEPWPDHGPVVLRVNNTSTRLWFPGDPFFSAQAILGEPWFTLFGDGTYVTYDGMDRYRPVTGHLSPAETGALVKTLIDDGRFFEVPEPPGSGFGADGCATDQDFTRIFLSVGDRERLLRIYGLDMYAAGFPPCGPAAATEPLMAIVRAIHKLKEPRPGARPYEVQRALLLVDPYGFQTSTTWPLALHLADGSRPLYGEQARDVLDVLVAQPKIHGLVATFREGDGVFSVSLRVYMPGAHNQLPSTPTPTSPGPTATPSGRPGDEPPPEAGLILNGYEHAMRVGSYCWDGLCADTFGHTTSRLTLRLASRNVLARLSLRTSLTPTMATLWATHVTLSDAVRSGEDQGEDWISWPWSRGEGESVLPGVAHEVLLTLAPGLNVLNVAVRWGRFADADYGLLVYVPGPLFLPLTIDRGSVRRAGMPAR